MHGLRGVRIYDGVLVSLVHYIPRSRFGPVLHDRPRGRPLPRPSPFRRALLLGMPISRVERIRRCACLMFGISRADLLGDSKESHLVDARMYAAIRMRSDLGLGTSEIGRQLGDRDSSTVLNLLRRAR